MASDVPHVLLINPWIHDFAAYDFWAKPLGLLTIGSILRNHGYKITYIDCLDRFHPKSKGTPKGGSFGKGHYLKMRIAKPQRLQDVQRNYNRYGISESVLRTTLKETPRPNAVLVTSMMTYWYPGLFALIEIIRDVMPGVPILLGGIYATLCYDHALKRAGADEVLSAGSETTVTETVHQVTRFASKPLVSPDNLDTHPYPLFDLQSAITYIPILTGRGCPFDCAYCASRFLNPEIKRRSPQHVVAEIEYWHKKYGVRDFPFYDDALLIDAGNHIMPILDKVITRGLAVRFHTPNALHIRPMTKELARLLFRAGFESIRLGLETASLEDRQTLDNKVTPSELEQAVCYLKEAGFTEENLGAYLLFGLPGQDLGQLETSVETAKSLGIKPVLAQYSPIPHTALWSDAVEASRYDLASDPIFHNNSIFPCQKEPFSWQKVSYLKKLTQ